MRKLLAALILFASCQHIPHKGCVTGKAIIPAYITTEMYLMGEVWMPTNQYHPEQYRIYFTGCDEKGCFDWWYNYSEYTYDNVNVGDSMTMN